MEKREIPQCPFIKQACIQERCALWSQLPVAAPGPLVGMARTGMVSGCSINQAAYFLGRLNALATSPVAGPRSPSG